MVERVLNTVAQGIGGCQHEVWAEREPNSIAPQRHGQAGYFLPPLSQVHDPVQTRFVVGQLTFVNDQSRFILTLEYLRDDLVEGYNFRLDAWSKKLQRQIGRGQSAGNSDSFLLDLALGEGPRRNHHGPVAFAYAAAAGHERVLVLNVGIGVEGNCGHIVHAFARLLIERFNVAERVRKAQASAPNLVGSNTINHEATSA